MTDVNPSMKKVEAGGTNNENHNSIQDRAGLFFGAFGMAVAFLSIGISWQSDKRHEDIARIQSDNIAQLETQVMLAREDLRAIAPQTTQLRSFREPAKK